MMGSGFVVFVYSIVYSYKHGERDLTGDPWDGRTLEWSLPSPPPSYNFARIPVVSDRDAWWEMKQHNQTNVVQLNPNDIQPIEMPKSSSIPFLMGLAFFVGGIGMVFEWWWVAILGGLGVVALLIIGSFDYNDHEEIHAETIRHTEASLGRLQG